MQTLLGVIFVIIGVFGMAVYSASDALLSADEKIAMLLGFFMFMIGVIIIYADLRNKAGRKRTGNAED